MAAVARGGRPVTLRDFLELGCDSSSDGFRSYPRCLPDALQQPPMMMRLADLRRSPSRSPSSLFSLARSPSSGGPGALARISSLSRSFSRRIREGFIWRRREEDDDDLYFVDERDSCDFPSPLVSSCSASSDSEYAESEADDLAIDDKMVCTPASDCEKPSTSSSSSSSSSSSADHASTDGAAADGNSKMQADGDPAAVGRSSKLGMEDKQQLSPVSVLDFPFDDDDADERSDAGTCSPSFHRCPPPPHPNLLHHTRTTKQSSELLHKIRRYDGIAQAVDLEARFTTTSDSGDEASTLPATTSSCTDTTTSSSSTTTTAAAAPRHGEEHQSFEQSSTQDDQEEEPEEYRLLARLLQEDDTAAVADEVSQMLFLDFFAEGFDRLRSAAAGSVVETARRPPVGDDRVAADEALVRAAAEWLRGAGLRWGIRDVMFSGKAALEDMERGRRWMCVAGEEEREVGAAVEGLLMDELVDELVMELVPCCWHGE